MVHFARSAVCGAILIGLALTDRVDAQAAGSAGSSDPAKRAQIASARAEMAEAQGRLRAAEARVRADYKAQPELLAAEAELKAAQSELEAAKKPILAKLSDDPAYKQELQAKQEADARIQQEFQKAVEADPSSTQPAASLPADRNPTDDRSVAADQESLNVPMPSDEQVVAAIDKANQRSKLREMENAAIAADPNAAAAAAKVDAATERLKALQLTFQAELLNNPDYKAALDQVNAARRRVIEASGSDVGTGSSNHHGGGHVH